MAGLTGDGVKVLVDQRFAVNLSFVTADTTDMVLPFRRDDHRVAGDFVIGCFVATGTGEVVAVSRHMDIELGRRIGQAGIEIAVLDGIAAAAKKWQAPQV